MHNDAKRQDAAITSRDGDKVAGKVTQ